MKVKLLDTRGKTRAIFDVSVAMTERARTKGLSNRKDIGDGMIFLFPRETVLPFTVAKMLVPIDIAWADGFGTILGMAKKLEPGSRFLARATAVPYRSALEVPGGALDRVGAQTGWKLSW